MGDKEDGCTIFPVQLSEQFNNFRLNGHIQRCGGLICHQDFRSAHDGRRNHHSLAHTTGQFVGILLVNFLWIRKFCSCQCPNRSFIALFLGHLGVNTQGFFHLPADFLHRIQAGHGLLENNGNIIALKLTHLSTGTSQKFLALKEDLSSLFHIFSG